jgi:integrase
MGIDRDVLLRGSYAPTTANKYSKAVNRFAGWCDAVGVMPTTSQQLDRYLSDYFVDLWFKQVGKHEASCTLYGLDMLLPGIKKRLDRSRRSLRGYNRLMPSVARPPLPATVATAIAVWLASTGRFSMAVGVLLSFDCYLRSGELLQVVREDFAMGTDARLGLNEQHRIHIHLRRCKTGRNQGVEVHDNQVKILVRHLLSVTKPGQRVFNFSASTYRRWFHRACSALKLSSDYVPHSLRHGGATRDYLAGKPIQDVMLRGRWSHPKTATHYIQQGRQLMMLQSVPSFVDEIGRTVLTHLADSIILLHALSQNTKVPAWYCR